MKTLTITWNVEDVQTQAYEMDVEITEDECEKVLDYIDQCFDASSGVSWDTIEDAIDEIKKGGE